MSEEIESRPGWDTQLAQEILGQLLLVGPTYFDSDGSFIEQQQFFGRVESAHSRNGILLSLDGHLGRADAVKRRHVAQAKRVS